AGRGRDERRGRPRVNSLNERTNRSAEVRIPNCRRTGTKPDGRKRWQGNPEARTDTHARYPANEHRNPHVGELADIRPNPQNPSPAPVITPRGRIRGTHAVPSL